MCVCARVLLCRLDLENTLNASLKRGTPFECPGSDTKQSYVEVLVMLEVLGMQSTSLFPSLPGPLWLGVVAPGRVLSMGQIELSRVLTQK